MDNAALEALFRSYSDDVFRLAYSYLGNRADAEDVCQSVFVKLAEGNFTLTPGKEKSWLLTCAANASKNTAKSFWRRNVKELDDSIPFLPPEDQALHDALMTLPPKYRIVIHLYYYEGYDQSEIAKMLNISKTNVQTRMHRARTILKKELNENDE